MDTWLSALPDKDLMSFVIGYRFEDAEQSKSEVWPDDLKEHKAVVVFLKGFKKQRLFCFPSIKYFSINTSGDFRFDNVMLEYNGFLVADQDSVSLPQLIETDIFKAADIVSLPAFVQLPKSVSQLSQDSFIVEEYRHPSYYVDLDDVRNNELAYLGLLKSNERRRQLKRSLQLLAVQGDLRIKKADSIQAGLEMYDDMLRLHQISWNKRGQSGAFANDFIKNFHRHLLSQGVYSDVCIFQITAGDIVIGYIYGFISQGRFLYYQSGFSSFVDNKIKAGMSCHALLIDYFSAAGLKRYDFLAGDHGYKESLPTGKENLSWLRVYRKKWTTSLLLNSRKLRSIAFKS